MFESDYADMPKQFWPDFATAKVYRASPTATCPTGTKGRLGVFEVFPVNKEVERIILETPTDLALGTYARSQGMKTMREDAIEKAIAGIIPFEEIAQV